ncbi:hybrid sensor histidine kinase/response regulator [Pedobacter insulae]|uniref:histidine kinase n=1 Tax=Pedobacter insulae TaxID=414048 RepID=A0A1I2YX68_9SPHI|nr:ATP-binding protein [Pedobacter insulae]SFH30268.1 Signal transduction histidine kinase [Pedobacter insulae]
MANVAQKPFIQATKGKVILGFLFACLALLAAWGVSKFVFKEMLLTVEKLSAPNDRLRIVNELSQKIARLDQLQRDHSFGKSGDSFITETKYLRKKLDTLSNFYENDQAQLQRIKTLKKLLSDRDKQFVKYLEVRETLVNTESFSDDVQKLNKLVLQRSRESDSAVLTTERATSTKTIAPDEEKKSKGFLNRLFGKKEAEVYKIINEEFKIKRDTLNALVEDSIMKGVQETLKSIEVAQRQKSQKFLKREAVLAESSNALTKQMLSILREVEDEVLSQIILNGANAREVVNEGAVQITVIIIAFFFITLVLVYLILTDITKSNQYRKAVELAKEEAEYHGKAKQRFLSNMSHEIRTPLQSILGYAEIITRQKSPEKKDINAIYQSAVHLLQIVNEVLDYSRITSGEFSFNNQVFSLRKVLEEVVAVMYPLAEQKSLKLVTRFDLEEVDHVVGDAFRLKQILFNLLGNAIKFTLKGHILLDVSFKQHGTALHFNFTIEDTGIGLSEEDCNRIFNEFEQVELAGESQLNQSGTGLGLTIVKSLVDRQSGRIYVKSELHKGSTFSVFLTYTLADEQLQKPVELLEHPIESRGKVWIIDDDKLILDLCELIFERNDIPYKSFSDVTDILAEALDESVKYVLIDMRLPKMSGVDLCGLLRERMSADVKFYAITAQVLPDERATVWSEGFNGIITKPFSERDLLSIFTTSVDTSIMDRSLLEKMTMGDKQMQKKIIARFKQDSNEDVAALKESLAQGDGQKSRLIIHRLAGRLAQIGAKDLAVEFRQIEVSVAQKESIDEECRTAISVLLINLERLLSVIEEAY